MLPYVLSGVLGYLIGSIPTAFLLVRWKSNVDIRSTGSGNAGALNSFQVTRSKMVGIAVLLIDLFKGILAVMLAPVIFDVQLSLQATAGVAAVAGHNFPVWLKFKGGRGLATAAGAMLMVSWGFILIWGILWAIGYFLTKNVNVGNAIASLGELLGVLVTPDEVLSPLLSFSVVPSEFKLFAVALFVVILTKHVAPMREYFASVKEKDQ